MPAWCNFRSQARAEQNALEAKEAAERIVNLRPQDPRFQNSPLKVIGDREAGTIADAELHGRGQCGVGGDHGRWPFWLRPTRRGRDRL